MLVHLVRTQFPEGPPISFEAINPSQIRSRSKDGNTVTVYLQTAVEFVMALEETQTPETLTLEEQKLYIKYLERRYDDDLVQYHFQSGIKLSCGESAVVPMSPSAH